MKGLKELSVAGQATRIHGYGGNPFGLYTVSVVSAFIII